MLAENTQVQSSKFHDDFNLIQILTAFNRGGFFVYLHPLKQSIIPFGFDFYKYKRTVRLALIGRQ